MAVGTAYFLYKLELEINKYLSYPFSTLSREKYADELVFPAISLCPVNSYNISELEKHDLFASYENTNLHIGKKVKRNSGDIPGDTFVDTLHNISISMEKMFVYCEWVARHTRDPMMSPSRCGPFNFSTYYNVQNQLCFTFNPGKGDHRLLSTSHSGLANGFELIMTLRVDEVVPIFPYTGLKVVLHHQSHPPQICDGFLVSPGFSTYVRMKKIERKGLPPPYATNCGESKLKYQSHYSEKACLLELLTDHVSRFCGCTAPYMPGNEDSKLPICSLNQTIHCLPRAREIYLESHDIETRRRICPKECVEVTFDYKLTEGLYCPAAHLEHTLPQAAIFSNTDLYNSRIEYSTSYVRDNLVNVFFFFEEMSYESYEQEGSLDLFQFLGDMGGEIGLMMGASILSFFEVIDLLLFLIYNLLLTPLHKRKKDKEEEEEEEYVEDMYGWRIHMYGDFDTGFGKKILNHPR